MRYPRTTLKSALYDIFDAHCHTLRQVFTAIAIVVVAYILPAWLLLAAVLEVFLGSSAILSTVALFLAAAIVVGQLELTKPANHKLAEQLTRLKYTWPLTAHFYKELAYTPEGLKVRLFMRKAKYAVHSFLYGARNAAVDAFCEIDREFRRRVIRS